MSAKTTKAARAVEGATTGREAPKAAVLNPLIADTAGSTMANVGSVLSALAAAFEAAEHDPDNPMTLEGTSAYGLALILRTCDQALGHAAGDAA